MNFIPAPSLVNQVQALQRALASPLLSMRGSKLEGERNKLLILDQIARRPMSVSAIAEAVGLTREAVHTHIAKMKNENPPRVVQADTTKRPATWMAAGAACNATGQAPNAGIHRAAEGRLVE